MKMLLMHSRETWYKAVKPAIEKPPDGPKEENIGESIVVFISVESEDGTPEVELAIKEILDHAKSVKIRRILVYPFAHLSQDLASPERAHSILFELESRLKNIPGYEIHRAPFGWYKAFKVICAGHPMCEVSRTIRAKVMTKGLFYLDERGNILSIDEAVKKELISGAIIGKSWEQKSIELFERFGLYPDLEPSGYVMVNELRKWALVNLRAKYYLFSKGIGKEKQSFKSFEQKMYLIIKDILDTIRYGVNEAIIKVSNAPGEEIVIAQPDGVIIDATMFDNLIERMSDHIVPLKIGKGGIAINYDLSFEGKMFFYKTKANGLTPLGGYLGVRGFQGVFIGPLLDLAKAVLDQGLRLAEQGETPSLPFWLAPYQVAIIPVKENNLNYSIMVRESIKKIARTYLDPPTKSLGSRIRLAARLWTPYIIIIGNKEVQTHTITVRRRRGKEQETMSLTAFIEELDSIRIHSPEIDIIPRLS